MSKAVGKLKHKVQKGLSHFIPSLLTILLALCVGAVVILVSGYNPLIAYRDMFLGAFGTKSRFSETIIKMVPLLILSLGLSVAFRSKVWNIGADGQFTMGAILAWWTAYAVGGEGFPTLALSFIAGALGGAIWGGVAGILKAKFKANEVITTLMLNYIANFFLAWLIRGPLLDPNGGNNPQTASVLKGLKLPRLFPGSTLRISVSVYVALVLIILIYFFWRSTWGYTFKLTGASQSVARYAGLGVPAIVCATMMISGALAGIAGWTEIFGTQYRLLDNISSGYGNLAIVVALLGDLRPVGITVASFFFAAMLSGGNAMQRTAGIPSSVVQIIQALVIIFVICRAVLENNDLKSRIRRKNKKEVSF